MCVKMVKLFAVFATEILKLGISLLFAGWENSKQKPAETGCKHQALYSNSGFIGVSLDKHTHTQRKRRLESGKHHKPLE